MLMSWALPSDGATTVGWLGEELGDEDCVGAADGLDEADCVGLGTLELEGLAD
jgi:hypothetical protein